MVKTIFIKALRDLKNHKGAYIACSLVMAIGITVFAGLSQMVKTFPVAQNDFYQQGRFGDGFADVVSMPASVLNKIESIHGVEKVSGRLVFETRVDNSEDRSVTLRTISYDTAEHDRLNDIFCVDGRFPDENSSELMLTENFFYANNMNLGDKITLAVRGQKYDFTVCGLVQSPEYVYVSQGGGNIIADDSAFGIAYISLKIMENIFDMSGEVNNVSVSLTNSEDIKNIRPDIENMLKPYGLSSFTEREDQNSNFLLNEEIRGLESIVSSVPILFLLVGVIIMMVIVRRTIEQQRTQIGLMKAIGYTNISILGHYSIYGFVIGLAAALIGGILASLVAAMMSEVFSAYFSMPSFTASIRPGDALQLSILSLACSIGASLLGARGVLKLQAAESMRPPAPPPGKSILVERIHIFWSRLKSIPQMVLRNIFRNKGRTIVTLFGMVICYSMIAAVFSFWPMFDFLLDREFKDVQRYDLKVGLHTASDRNSTEASAEVLPGVSIAEGMAELPVMLLKDEKYKEIILIAVSAQSDQYIIYGADEKPMELPADGITLSDRLADMLGVGVGDEILLDMPWPDTEKHIVVTGICKQYMGLNAFINLDTMSKQLNIPDIANSVMLKIDPDPGALEKLTERLDNAQNVSSYANAKEVLISTKEQYAVSMSALYFMAVMAIFAGFAILYNSSVIALSERTRELASMRVLGFSIQETTWVIALEQIILLSFGILIGIPTAGVMMQGLGESMASDAYEIPAAIPFISHVYAFVSTALSLAAATYITQRKIRKLDLVEILKERE